MPSSRPDPSLTNPARSLDAALSALERDDWEGAHRIVQSLDGPAAAWLHGVLHLIEGDEANAHYWYRRAGRPCPGTAQIQQELQAIRQAAAG